MPTINIKGVDYPYDPQEIISFSEGLIGFPGLRRAVLIPLEEYPPFSWLASIDEGGANFIVVEPHLIYTDYQPDRESSREAALRVLAIVTIASEWQKTTLNTRAPVFIDTETSRGVQVILNDSRYDLAVALPED